MPPVKRSLMIDGQFPGSEREKWGEHTEGFGIIGQHGSERDQEKSTHLVGLNSESRIEHCDARTGRLAKKPVRNVIAHLKSEIPSRSMQKGDVAGRDTSRGSDCGEECPLVIVDGVEKRVDDSLNQAMKKTEGEEEGRDSGESNTGILEVG